MSAKPGVRRCDIWLADLSPIVGSEQGGKRPVVVISGDTLNTTLPVSLCCPISSKVKGYPATLKLQPSKVNGLKLPSEIIVFQTRTISHHRLINRIGSITEGEHTILLSHLRDLCTL